MVFQKLVPDENVISTIFSNVFDSKPAGYNIISNTYETCTFSTHFEVTPLQGCPDAKDFLVRLETSPIAEAIALHRLAHSQLPGLTPAVITHGTTVDASGRDVNYCVTEFCVNTVPLEDVWDTLEIPHQEDIMDMLVHAMETLQRLNLRTLSSRGDMVGDPKSGYFAGIEHFLKRLTETSNETCTLSHTEHGIALESVYNDIGRVEMTQQDLKNLMIHVVLCHNDLEPRNILVKRDPTNEGSSSPYRLAAIIDWEMAGCYPYAYEYGLKDGYLGLSNLSFTWYSLFKERTHHMLPPDECSKRLITSLRIIDESKKRRMTGNVGVRFQEKWLAREYLERSRDSTGGWNMPLPC